MEYCKKIRGIPGIEILEAYSEPSFHSKNCDIVQKMAEKTPKFSEFLKKFSPFFFFFGSSEFFSSKLYFCTQTAKYITCCNMAIKLDSKKTNFVDANDFKIFFFRFFQSWNRNNAE